MHLVVLRKLSSFAKRICGKNFLLDWDSTGAILALVAGCSAMLKISRLTAVLCVILLALICGCSSQFNFFQAFINTTKSAAEPETLAVAPLNTSDPATQQKIQQFVNRLAAKGFPQKNQGIWMQVGNTVLANHQGTVPLPAASITKVATTLVALQTFGPDHRFVTQFGTTGSIQNGVLQGDLVIQGGEDPLFVWEEAIAIGNLLNQMGIKQVRGNLVIAGKFYMNFESDRLKSGNLLKQGLNAQIWPAAAKTQYRTLPPGTPKPQVAIAGSLRVTPTIPSNVKPLVRHYSPPLAELLKTMNEYSNNMMNAMLIDSLGGLQAIAQKSAESAGVPQTEIQLTGSDFKRVSPRAACAMFLAIERYLQPYQMTIGDVFAIVGQDPGILNQRWLPRLSVIKSGQLKNVNAIAGALPTQKQGTVWFAIMNFGNYYDGFSNEQQLLLKNLLNEWGTVQSLPAELTPLPDRKNNKSKNEIFS
jgi:serine-type D-Ala-D-Ala carboxypeptidase/endopeptidase (penicillin-binding protein 4)